MPTAHEFDSFPYSIPEGREFWAKTAKNAPGDDLIGQRVRSFERFERRRTRPHRWSNFFGIVCCLSLIAGACYPPQQSLLFTISLVAFALGFLISGKLGKLIQTAFSMAMSAVAFLVALYVITCFLI